MIFAKLYVFYELHNSYTFVRMTYTYNPAPKPNRHWG